MKVGTCCGVEWANLGTMTDNLGLSQHDPSAPAVTGPSSELLANRNAVCESFIFHHSAQLGSLGGRPGACVEHAQVLKDRTQPLERPLNSVPISNPVRSLRIVTKDVLL